MALGSGWLLLASIFVPGGEFADELGESIALADVNGDGYDDVVASAYSGVHVWLGGPSMDDAVDAKLAVDAYHDWLSVTAAGDVDADGYEEVFFFDPVTNRLLLYRGGPSGIAAEPSWSYQLQAATSSTWLEHARLAVGAGDVDADGYGDVLVGDPTVEGGRGRISLHLGSPAGITAPAVWTVTGDAQGYLGFAIDVGDVDGDGLVDAIVSAPSHGTPSVLRGRVYVFRGNGIAFDATPLWTESAYESYGWFGKSVAFAGDVNGDGYGDVLVGKDEWKHNPPSTAQGGGGRAYLFLGSAAGPGAEPSWVRRGHDPLHDFNWPDNFG